MSKNVLHNNNNNNAEKLLKRTGGLLVPQAFFDCL